MKIGELVIALGILLMVFAYATHKSSSPGEPETSCNSLEESKLKIALDECSAAVMECAWGEVDETR